MFIKILNTIFNYLIIPIINGLIFSMGFFIIVSMIMAPLSLYLGSIDGLWNFQRSIFVSIGLPALTLTIFNFNKIKKSMLIKVWSNYFTINGKVG